MQNPVSISIGIPAHNEEQNIKQLIFFIVSQKGNFILEKIKHGTINIKNTALILSAFFYPYDIYQTYQTNN